MGGGRICRCLKRGTRTWIPCGRSSTNFCGGASAIRDAGLIRQKRGAKAVKALDALGRDNANSPATTNSTLMPPHILITKLFLFVHAIINSVLLFVIYLKYYHLNVPQLLGAFTGELAAYLSLAQRFGQRVVRICSQAGHFKSKIRAHSEQEE